MEEKNEITKLLEDGLDIKAAIQIAKIVSNAPEERLPMILDIFSQAGVEISGMETIEAIKNAVRERSQIANLEEFLEGLTKLAPAINGEHRILVEVFDSYCTEHNENIRNVRRTLAEMQIIRMNKLSSGKLLYSVPVYDPATKKIARCICISEEWRKLVGVND
jgi:hypothetical protein